MIAQVSRPPGFKSFLKHQTQGLAQSVNHRNWCGMVVKALLAPVALDHAHVEVPALYLRLAAVDRLDGARTERHRRQTGRTAQAFLRAAVHSIDAPFIDGHRYAAQRRYRIEQEQRIELVAQGA